MLLSNQMKQKFKKSSGFGDKVVSIFKSSFNDVMEV